MGEIKDQLQLFNEREGLLQREVADATFFCMKTQ